MKIAFTIERYWPNALGGGEESTRLLARKLALHGHGVTVFSGDRSLPEGLLDQGAEWDGPVRVLPLHRLRSVSARERFRVFHAHSSRVIPVTLRIARRRRTGAVATLRDFSCVCPITNPYGDCSSCRSRIRCAFDTKKRYGYGYKWWVGLGLQWARFVWNRRMLEQYDQLIFVSETLMGWAMNRGLSGRRLMAIHNMPPPEPTSPKRFTASPFVFFAGKLSLGKGAHVLRTAAEIVHRINPNVRFCFAGRETAQVRISSNTWIENLGVISIERVRAILRNSAWVAVAPSICHEGFSRMVLEAGMAEVPVIVTDRGGSHEGVMDCLTGYVIPPDNPDLLAVKIFHIAESMTRALVMGRAGRRHVCDRFNPLSLMDAHIDAYRRLPGGHDETI